MSHLNQLPKPSMLSKPITLLDESVSPINRRIEEPSQDSALNVLATPHDEPAKEYYVEAIECHARHGSEAIRQRRTGDSPEAFDAGDCLLVSKLRQNDFEDIECADYRLEWHTPAKEDQKEIKSLLKVTCQPKAINTRIQQKLKEYKDKVYFNLNRIQGSFLKDSPAKPLCYGKAEVLNGKMKLYKDVHKQISSLGSKQTRNRRDGKTETPDDGVRFDIVTPPTTTGAITRKCSSFLKPDLCMKSASKCRNNRIEMGRCKSEAGSCKKLLAHRKTTICGGIVQLIN